MKITIAQISPILGDIEANKALILSELDQCNSDIIIFPECALSGYPPTDHWHRVDFKNACSDAIKDIILISKNYSQLLIVGAPVFNNNRWYNSALCISNGELLHRYDKQLLPNYDIFNESRYFSVSSQSPLFKWNGVNIGLLICEDAWFNKQLGYNHDPCNALEGKDIDLMVHIAASPFEVDKDNARNQQLFELNKRVSCPVVSVNQVGAYTDIIFDGASKLIQNGEIMHQLRSFKSHVHSIDLDNCEQTLSVKPFNKLEQLETAISFGLNEYMKRSKMERVVVAVSGGIDSALVAALAVGALGAENVTLVSMPTQYNSTETKHDARALATNLGCKFYEQSIEDVRGQLTNSVDQLTSESITEITHQNIQARLRGLVMMSIANNQNALLLTTGNKSELAMGYATLYGDMCGGLNIIGDLFKTDVFELANHLNRHQVIIPVSIINREPSAELALNQKDSDSLPNYKKLDKILHELMIKNISLNECIKMNDKNTVEFVMKKLAFHEFKRYQSPPILKLSSKSFGRGWQYPVVS